MGLVPKCRLVDAALVTWNDDTPAPTAGSPLAHDPVVIMRGLTQRGIRFDGLSEDKVRLRLRLCVKQGFLSLVQSVAVREYLDER